MNLAVVSKQQTFPQNHRFKEVQSKYAHHSRWSSKLHCSSSSACPLYYRTEGVTLRRRSPILVLTQTHSSAKVMQLTVMRLYFLRTRIKNVRKLAVHPAAAQKLSKPQATL